MDAATSPAPCCGDCRFYRARHTGPEAAARAEAAGMGALLPPGLCRRFPKATPSGPEDWCGEFQSREA